MREAFCLLSFIIICIKGLEYPYLNHMYTITLSGSGVGKPQPAGQILPLFFKSKVLIGTGMFIVYVFSRAAFVLQQHN